MFGELEFWFALIKVVTIILMIIAGLGVILFGFGNGGHAVGISNLWSHGGFFTGGAKGFIYALAIVLASYQGIELIGVTAGEAENPQHTRRRDSLDGCPDFDLLRGRNLCDCPSIRGTN